MANAGTVSVDFVAATSQFTAEVRKVQGSLKGMEGSLKSLERVGSTALSFLSAGALTVFTKSAFAAADAIGDTAERAGVAVESFSRLKFAAEQTDVELGSLAVSMKKFQTELSKAADGGTAAAGAFAQIGLSGRELKQLNLEQQLGAVADAFRRIESPADRVRVATELFGRAGADLIPLLREGSIGINRLTAEADRLGITMNATTALGISEADKALKRFIATAQSAVSDVLGRLSLLLSPPQDEAGQLAVRIAALQRERQAILNAIKAGDKNAGSGFLGQLTLTEIDSQLAPLEARLRTLQEVASGVFSQRGILLPLPWLDQLKEIDLAQIQQLRIPDDPFGDRFDSDVVLAQAREEFREATLTLAQEVADSQKQIEAGVTADLQQQLQIRSQAVTAFQNQQLTAENAMAAARKNALSAGIQALQAFAGQSKKVAIALVLINKAKAIGQAIQNTLLAATLQATSGDPYTALARAAVVKAWGFAQVAAIAATGYGEIQAINQSGGAPRGSAVNPIFTNETDDDDSGASSQRTVQVVINGNFFGNRETIDMLIEEIKAAVDDRDVVLISGTSRNAKDLLGG